MPLFGQEHADRYRETDGEEGHDWAGTTVLLLTTTGRKSGAERTTPLIYQRHGDDYLVVASNGGGAPPGWFLNLQDDPIVDVQVKADHHTARARVATAEEKPELWRIMTATGTPYDDFQAKADREIPVVVLEPTAARLPIRVLRRQDRRRAEVRESPRRLCAGPPARFARCRAGRRQGARAQRLVRPPPGRSPPSLRCRAL